MPTKPTKRQKKIDEEIKAQLKEGKSRPEAEAKAERKNNIVKARLKAR